MAEFFPLEWMPGDIMTEETKSEIISAWNRHVGDTQRRYRKNEGSTVQLEDTKRLFKEGILNHASLSKKEKVELLTQFGMPIA